MRTILIMKTLPSHAVSVAAAVLLVLFVVLLPVAAHAQGAESVIVYRYSDVHDGRVFTEFGRLHYTGVFEVTGTYYNPTSICTVDTLRAITGRTVIDQADWDASAAFYSQSFYITGTVYEVEGNPRYIVHARDELSATAFTVNGSTSPGNSVADTVLRFAAGQSRAAAGVSVRVQATTTPNTESTWTDLANSRGGRMTFDVARNGFVLNSTDYPLQNGVYFRAISSAPTYTDSISNVVPPVTQPGFNLASSKPHLPPTRLYVEGNNSAADLYFLARVASVQSGVSLRVQASTAPGNEASWTDLSNGNAGHMQQSTRQNLPNQFLLLVNNYPAAQGLFFRAVASVSGSVDSISQPVGAFNLVSDVPPKVTITPPAALSGSGDGHDADQPILVANGLFSFGANVQTSRALKNLKLQIDGATLASFQNGEKQGSVVTLNVVGDHVLEALAVDDLGATGRAGTGVIYIRIVPAPSSATAERTASDTDTVAASIGKTFVAAPGTNFWVNRATWKDQDGNPVNNVPGPDDFAIIGSSSNVGFSGSSDNPENVSVKSLTLNGGKLFSTGTKDNLTILGIMTITGGEVNGPLKINIKEGAQLLLLNPSDISFNANQQGVGSIDNHGTCNLHGSGGIHGLDGFSNGGTLNWQMPLSAPLNAALDPAAGIRMIDAKSRLNSGLITGKISLLIGDDGSGLITSDGAGIVNENGGTLLSHDGSSLLNEGGGSLIGDVGSELLSRRGPGMIGQDGAGLVTDQGAAGPARSSSTSVEAASASSGFVQSGGETDLSHVLILGPATINGGSLTGSGIIAGDLTNNSFISPGHGAGSISVLGNYTQSAQGTMIIENGGAGPKQYDRLQVHGVASLNGKLDIRDINGYVHDPADTFNPIGFQSASGSFSSVSSNAQVTLTKNGIRASVDPSVPAPKAGQPLNISTRMNVLSGDNVLIGGFIVTGPSGSTKKVLIRGIGPSLSNFGISGTLSDPLLELHKPDGSVVTNDNWQQGDTSQIPTGFAPSDPRESVVVATLTPGNYTAVLKGAHGETGIGLAEVYDLDSTSAAQLANISTRGFVNTGDNVMIGGFIVGGSEPTKVLVRAIGPSLASFGVQGALSATTLELHDANGAVISNEGWRNTQEADIIATTIPPNNDDEAAIVATLVPGNYTAIVRGKNNTTGIGLVEAYNLQ